MKVVSIEVVDEETSEVVPVRSMRLRRNWQGETSAIVKLTRPGWFGVRRMRVFGVMDSGRVLMWHGDTLVE